MQPRVKWTLIALGAIWVTVLLTSFFAPDMVTGSEQQHLKLPALLNWIWGALATLALLRAARFRTGSGGSWMAAGIGTTLIWAAVLGFSLWGPVVETGTDPTTIPLSVIIAPVAGMLLTRFLVEFTFDLKDSITGQ